jgi:hypothetical protein
LTWEFLTKNNSHPGTQWLFSIPNWRYLHFHTIEVIQAELQAVLPNTLTEQDLQDAFKKLQKHWEWCTHMKGDYFKCKICGFHGGDYEECHLLGCDAIWLL